MSSNSVVDTLLSSFVPGFGNLPGATAVANVPSTGLSAGASANFSASTALSRDDAIPEAHVSIPDFGTQSYLINGIFSLEKPSHSPDYNIGISMRFSSSTVSFDIEIINFSGGSITVPAQDITFNIYLYKAPW